MQTNVEIGQACFRIHDDGDSDGALQVSRGMISHFTIADQFARLYSIIRVIMDDQLRPVFQLRACRGR